MFDEPLPIQVDLRKLAGREAHFSAKLSITVMQRIAESAVGENGFIDVDLHIGVDEYRDRYLKGSVHCEAEVICQRCLQPVSVVVDAPIHLHVVWDEKQAQQLRGDIDPLIIGEDDLVNLNEVLEDELLLSFPLVSHHEDGECPSKHDYELPSEEAAVKVVAEEKENPFSVLAKLKANKE